MKRAEWRSAEFVGERTTMDVATLRRAKLKEQRDTLAADLNRYTITVDESCKQQRGEFDKLSRGSGDTIDLRFKQEELRQAQTVHAMISERALKLQAEQGRPSVSIDSARQWCRRPR